MTHDDSPTSPIDLPPPDPGTPAGVDAMPASPPPPPPGVPAAAPGPPTASVQAAPPQPAAGWNQGPQPAPASQGAWGATSGTQPAPAAPAAAPRGGNQAGLVFGVLLLVVGGLLLVTRLADIQLSEDAWPLWIIIPGLAMLIASFAVPPRGGLGLAVPGAVIATIGAILWVQDTYDAWQTWAYAWALVGPTAPGVGTLLYGLVKGQPDLVRDGFRATVTGLALFAGFALFFEGVLGLSGEPIANLDDVLPFAIIGLGLLLVVASLFGGSRRRERRAR